jgi:hypothetical protein
VLPDLQLLAVLLLEHEHRVAVVNVAKVIAKQLKKYGKPIGVKSCTLIKITNGTRTPGSISGGTNPTPVSYPATGFIESYDADDIDGTLILASDRKISILGGTLPAGIAPTDSDQVTIADATGLSATYAIMKGVQGDGVGAVYSMQGRKVT